jgi:hypothetical protein
MFVEHHGGADLSSMFVQPYIVVSWNVKGKTQLLYSPVLVSLTTHPLRAESKYKNSKYSCLKM